MRLTVSAAAVGSVVALVGFAGAANASATIDLIWADTGTDTITNANSSSAITLQVILTAGPNGSEGAGVSVDYGATKGKLVVLGYANTPSEGFDSALPIQLGDPIDTGSRIENINSVAIPPLGIGTGLAAGQSHQLGTVTFQTSVFISGTLEIQSDANGLGDGVVDIDGNLITATTTFNRAFLTNFDVHEHDFDGDGVADTLDNCLGVFNADQDDTDGDDCGNLCDADYGQSGLVSMGDFGAFAANFGTTNNLYQHTPPITPTTSVSIGDFGFFAAHFGKVPGPSGTTAGTTACP